MTVGVQRRGLSLSDRKIRAKHFQQKRYLSWILRDKIHVSGGGDGGVGEGIPGRDNNTSKDTVMGKLIANVREV